jgi:hypothetical protein
MRDKNFVERKKLKLSSQWSYKAWGFRYTFPPTNKVFINCNTPISTVRAAVCRQLLAGGLDSVTGKSIYGAKRWHWGRFFSQYFGFMLPITISPKSHTLACHQRLMQRGHSDVRIKKKHDKNSSFYISTLTKCHTHTYCCAVTTQSCDCLLTGWLNSKYMYRKCSLHHFTMTTLVLHALLARCSGEYTGCFHKPWAFS